MEIMNLTGIKNKSEKALVYCRLKLDAYTVNILLDLVLVTTLE